MASIEFLQDQMERDWETMNDSSKPAHIRHVARNRFWHCSIRVGTMKRGGLTEDEPGHFLIGYSEEEEYRAMRRSADARDKAAKPAAISLSEARKDQQKAAYADLVMQTFRDAEHADRRELLERRAAVEAAAREKL